jgi:hypothetical protein
MVVYLVVYGVGVSGFEGRLMRVMVDEVGF